MEARSSGGEIGSEGLPSRPVKAAEFSRLLHFDQPVTVIMDGHRRSAVILKPGAGDNDNGQD